MLIRKMYLLFSSSTYNWGCFSNLGEGVKQSERRLHPRPVKGVLWPQIGVQQTLWTTLWTKLPCQDITSWAFWWQNWPGIKAKQLSLCINTTEGNVVSSFYSLILVVHAAHYWLLLMIDRWAVCVHHVWSAFVVLRIRN